MKPSLRLAVTSLLVCAASGVALAQAPSDTEEAPPAAPTAPPVVQVYTPKPIFPAPLSQTTQSTYVPQSVALSGPQLIVPELDTQAPPDGYSVSYRKRKGLLIAGPITLGVPYLYSVLVGAIGHDAGSDELSPLVIPVAGPFILLGDSRTNGSWTGDALLIADGVAQVAGAAMLYYGLTSPKRVFVRNDLLSRTMILPTATSHGPGFALTTTF